MSIRELYRPGAAEGAEVRRDGDHWTLILVRELRHRPAKVWEALTDPAQLREWAPFDTYRSLASTGPVRLSTVGAPKTAISETRVTRADPPGLLEYKWGDGDLRWQLDPLNDGTRLTLWHNIDRNYLSMGAAGWHICLDVLEGHLAGKPLGRIVGGDAMNFDWPRLNNEYAQQFGIKSVAVPPI